MIHWNSKVNIVGGFYKGESGVVKSCWFFGLYYTVCNNYWEQLIFAWNLEVKP
jgi:hypothetical protein